MGIVFPFPRAIKFTIVACISSIYSCMSEFHKKTAIEAEMVSAMRFRVVLVRGQWRGAEACCHTGTRACG
jgi:hypothetical protein